MKRERCNSSYVILLLLIPLFSIISVGYSSWADTLEVNGSISLAISSPTPEPSATSSPIGISISAIGYNYNGNETFVAPKWDYNYSAYGNVQKSGYANPTMFLDGNRLKVSARIEIPILSLIPKNADGTFKSPNERVLYHNNSSVGAAVLFTNNSSATLQFTRGENLDNFVESFALVNKNNALIRKNLESIPYYLMDNDMVNVYRTMVISAFTNDNWAAGSRRLDEFDSQYTLTQTKVASFNIYNTSTGIASTFNFEFVATFVLTNGDPNATPLPPPTPTPVQTVTPPPVPAAVSSITGLSKTASGIGYRYSIGDSFQSPYWRTKYKIGNSGALQEVILSPQSVWDGNFLNIIGNLEIPVNMNQSVVIKQITHDIGAGILFTNAKDDVVKISQYSVNDTETRFVYAGSTSMNFTNIYLPYPSQGQGNSGSYNTVIASAFKNYWNCQDVTLVPGSSYTETREAVFRATNTVTNEYCDFTVRFIMNIIAITPAQSQLVGLSDDMVSEAGAPYPTVSITEQPSVESQLKPLDAQLSEDIVDNAYAELPVETESADSSAEIQAVPQPSTEVSPELSATDTMLDAESSPVLSVPPTEFTAEDDIMDTEASNLLQNPEFPAVKIANRWYEDTWKASHNSPSWEHRYVDRSQKAVEDKLFLSSYWKNNILTIYGNVYIPQTGTPGSPLLQSFEVNTGAAMEIVNDTGVNIELSLASLSNGLEHSFAVKGGSITQQKNVLLTPGTSITVSAFIKDAWSVNNNGLDLENQPGMSYLQEKEATFQVANTVTGQSKTYTLQFALSLKTEEPVAIAAPPQTPAPEATGSPAEYSNPTETPTASEPQTSTSTTNITSLPQVTLVIEKSLESAAVSTPAPMSTFAPTVFISTTPALPETPTPQPEDMAEIIITESDPQIDSTLVNPQNP